MNVNIEPANNTIAVTSDEEIVALYTGASPNPNTIMFRFWGDNTRYSMYELCGGDIADSGAGLIGRYNWGKYGNKIIRNWGYLSAQDNIAGEPQLKRFPLTDIDNMRTAILASPPTNEFIVNDYT